MAREFTARDEQELLELLHALDERRQAGLSLPPNVFNGILKLLPQIAVECVLLRRSDDGTPRGHVSVYLTYRGDDAPSHQNTWHVPGSFLRSRERVSDVMARLSAQELTPAQISSWQFLRLQNCNLEPRGHTVSCVYLCALTGAPTGGQWCSCDTLPPNLSDSQHDIIATAVQHFLTEPFL